MGINSWLEDELYRQYLHDHSAVDESWQHVFEENGGARPAEETIPLPNGSGSDVRGADAAAEAVPAEWQPLRGAAGTHRGEYGGFGHRSAGHFAAHHRRQGDG